VFLNEINCNTLLYSLTKCLSVNPKCELDEMQLGYGSSEF
jgi:hypothetical protein